VPQCLGPPHDSLSFGDIQFRLRVFVFPVNYAAALSANETMLPLTGTRWRAADVDFSFADPPHRRKRHHDRARMFHRSGLAAAPGVRWLPERLVKRILSK
jgi:hypothetical protein